MDGFTSLPLDDAASVWVGTLPEALTPVPEALAAWWDLRPEAPDEIVLYGRPVMLPRLQRAYGQDYRFSGQTAPAHPIPDAFAPYLAWAKERVDPRMNGMLVNWYDAASGHRIGPHRDSAVGLVPGASIVTISLGAPRTFRLRAYRAAGRVDLPVRQGTVVVIPWSTNRRWTHEVPHFVRDRGRRISLTVRAFASDAPSG